MTTDTTTGSHIDVAAPAGPALLADDELAAVGGGSWFDSAAKAIVDLCGGFILRRH